ncbi:MAG: acyltransferase [Rikenellaceae bacterium]|nr:acyltransferase [Rikenellaceae bacterium]
MQFRNDIQGLRSLAVLFVFFFHLSPSLLPGGFVGVDIFFVISGFLISSIVLAQKDKGNFSFAQFYKSRIRRIVPAYYFLLLVVAVSAVFIYLGVDTARLRLALLHADFFNSNAYFSSADTYFGASSSENPLLHTWTLAIEMKFYIFLPMLLVWIRKKWLPGVIAILTAALFIYANIGVASGNKGEIYFALLARTPEFFIGVLAAIIVRSKPTVKPTAGAALNITGFALLFISALFINENSAFPGALALLPCLGTAFIIIFPDKYTLPVLTNKPMVFVGEISYSVYLWHWPVMAYMRYYYSITEFSLGQIIIICLSTVSLSLLSYYFVERVFRKSSAMKLWIGLSILLALNVIIANSIVRLNKKVEHIPIAYTAPSLGLDSHSGSFRRAETFGDTLRGDRILLIGDSHASVMKPYLDRMGRVHNFSFRTITNDTYANIPGIPENVFTAPRFYRRYLHILGHTYDELDNCQIVILILSDKSMALYGETIADFIENLRTDQAVILFSDFPRIDKNPVRINRNFIKNQSRRNVYTKIYGRPGQEILRAVESRPNAFFADFTGSDIFRAAPFYNDTLMYYDNDHLNFYGSIKYSEASEQEFILYLDAAREYIESVVPES